MKKTILILKRNKKLQHFNENKILASIINSASDCKYSLNQSDINLLEKEIKNIIYELLKRKNTHILSSLELKTIIYETLIKNKFNKIARAYIET